MARAALLGAYLLAVVKPMADASDGALAHGKNAPTTPSSSPTFVDHETVNGISLHMLLICSVAAATLAAAACIWARRPRGGVLERDAD